MMGCASWPAGERGRLRFFGGAWLGAFGGPLAAHGPGGVVRPALFANVLVINS